MRQFDGFSGFRHTREWFETLIANSLRRRGTKDLEFFLLMSSQIRCSVQFFPHSWQMFVEVTGVTQENFKIELKLVLRE